MKIPIYTLDTVPVDAPSSHVRKRDPKKRACVPPMRIPIFKVVLRKEGTLRVPRRQIDSPVDAHEVAFALIGDRPFEHSVALFVNAKSAIVGAIIIVTMSSVSSVAVTIRGIFTGAIVHNAAAIILAHNHPSGSTAPSDEDVRVTEKAREAAEILGIPVLDHLIITADPSRWQSLSCQ